MTPKSCKQCGSPNHSAWVHKPRKPLQTRKRMNKTGKITKQWKSARELWLKRHPYQTFACFYCKKTLNRSEITLDHYHSRGRHPELRNELSNIVVACWPCNQAKGSLSGDEYLAQIKDI